MSDEWRRGMSEEWRQNLVNIRNDEGDWLENIVRFVLADADYYRAALGMDAVVPGVRGQGFSWGWGGNVQCIYAEPEVAGHRMTDAPAGYDTSRSVLQQRLGVGLSDAEGRE